MQSGALQYKRLSLLVIDFITTDNPLKNTPSAIEASTHTTPITNHSFASG
jgi:hypothetical protein